MVNASHPIQDLTLLKAEVRNLSFFYGNKQILKEVSIRIVANQITALMGPSGCGKTTFLRCFNRLHDLYPGNRYEGEIRLGGVNILSPKIDPIEVRMRVGMVFQKPNPFPKSIYDNVAYGLLVRGLKNRSEIDDRIEAALKTAALWNEVKDRLKDSATSLSGGQQQRLCIARALVTEPEIVLFDEPTSALDPISTAHIEELMTELKQRVTILIVTHSLQQAARFSDYAAFMYLGELIEYDKTMQLFAEPSHPLTKSYLEGVMG